MKRSTALLILAATLLGASAAAQPPAKQGAATSDSNELVVTGRRNVDKDIRAFVGALAKPSHGDQLATYKEEVCPAVHGLREASAEIVVRRMRRVAAASGLHVAPQRCTPNILLIVVPDKKAALGKLRREMPGVFGEMARDDVDALVRSDAPVAAWHIVEARGTGGEDIGSHDGSPATVSWAVPWRLASNVRIQLEGTVVLIEASAIQGRTLMQVADYAAMRSYADIKPDAAASLPAPTILTLFDKGRSPDAAPQSVTQWDFSYLKALYATRSDMPGHLQQGAIAHAFKKDLQGAAEPPKRE